MMQGSYFIDQLYSTSLFLMLFEVIENGRKELYIKFQKNILNGKVFPERMKEF